MKRNYKIGIGALVVGGFAGWFSLIDERKTESVYDFQYQGMSAWVEHRDLRALPDEYKIMLGNSKEWALSKGQAWIRHGCLTSDDNKTVCVNVGGADYFVADANERK